MTNELQNPQHLIELAEALNQQNNFREILRLVSQRASQLLKVDSALIMMLNPRTQQTVKTIFKEGEEKGDSGFPSVQNQISGWIMKYKAPLLTANIKEDPRFARVDWGDALVQSVLGVPLMLEGMVIGSLILFNKQGNEFDKTDLAYLEKLAVIAAPYLRNVQEIQEYFETPLPAAALLAKYEALGLLGKSPRFIELLQAVEAAARCDVRVLLEGQSGTGKELIARAIHQLSSRAEHRFVVLDCGALPVHLIESELFGYVKGAFTGAMQNRKGLIEEAHQGTMFMDEITNLPYEMQAKLLRVLQEGEVRPVGSNTASPVDVRIIAAASTSLRKLVDEKHFREDLYYRLHVYPISIPQLSDRREDIPALANYFLKQFSYKQQKKVTSFHGSLLNFMKESEWRGNIRELENFVERLVTVAPSNSPEISSDLIPMDIQDEFRQFINRQKAILQKSLKEQIKEKEEQIIREVLEAHSWNQSKAAQSLGITEQVIRYRMKKLGIIRVKRSRAKGAGSRR